MKMKKIFFLCAASLAMLSFSGCSDDINYETGNGEGRVLLRPLIQSDVKVVSRAGETDTELESQTIIWISNSKGAVRKYNGIAEVPAAGVTLLADHYGAEAWAGDSVPASFDARYFKGSQPFTIEKNSTVQVEIECKIANAVVQVKYAEGVEEYISDCSMTVGHKGGSLTFEGETATKPGYFMMPSFDPDLQFSFTAKGVDGSDVKFSDVIKDAAPGHKYILTVTHDGPTDSSIGGALVTVVVDDSEIEVEDSYEITAAPAFRALNFMLDQPVTGTEHSLTEKKLWLTTAAPLTSLTFSCPGFAEMLGISDDTFEFFGMQPAIRDMVQAKGLTTTLTTHDDTGFCEMKIVFEDQFMQLFGNGEYPLSITAVDANNRSTTVLINILVSDAKVMVVPVEENALTTYTDRVTVYGTALQDGLDGFGFNYRQKGASSWNYIEATLMTSKSRAAGDTFSAEITGLTPGTTYEYQAVSGSFTSVDILTITTEKAEQLPNAGFEDWCTEGKVVYAASSPDSRFWDSGNHGSATMNKTVTDKTSDIKHSGMYAAKLSSQFVGIGSIGKFAAGNLFVGEYLATDGTDGVLGWGRPFASRPKALKGYVRYQPVAVTHDNDDYADLKKGDMDNGIIYIALLDETVNEYNGKRYPVIIKTKNNEKENVHRQLFDKNASNVIAYGELIFDRTTEGSGMVEFNIPLEYKRTDVKPSNIMVTCAASKGGDYFTGGNGSVMYVDDLELVY